jgi:hypothetical protein
MSRSVTLNGEHGAKRHTSHGAERPVVMAMHRCLAGREDLVMVFHNIIGREPAILH